MTQVPAALAGLDDPFLLHHVAPDAVRRAWRRGEAAVVEMERPVAEGVRVMTAGVGPTADLGPLLVEVAAEADRPWRLIVDEDAAASLPPAWRPSEPRSWHWMLTRTPPAPVVGEDAVTEVEDAAEIDGVLDAAMPETHARPGTVGIECWLGVRAADGVLAGVGAVARQPDGTGNLRGIAVLPSYGGRGLGTALSAALTRRALAGASGVATLGVYVDNAPAIAVYARLGFATRHTFYSGQLAG
ncbi:GNAT family N-acetyltransferase [Nocardioides sp. CFH 31398]|uniref:GNAT family N-acetyltransferase n=1 Tax=Nocardioides sp. CFH 31398 TaxID=2919579 RepID=UPI001F0579ED|nr:GNAT family N-acetyltransferase [Nocardioides sp. CFH 31398]MCH1866261.1 GNAT family N-acetyltransferase [Nocardioides sp. CFH 31398]